MASVHVVVKSINLGLFYSCNDDSDNEDMMMMMMMMIKKKKIKVFTGLKNTSYDVLKYGKLQRLMAACF